MCAAWPLGGSRRSCPSREGITRRGATRNSQVSWLRVPPRRPRDPGSPARGLRSSRCCRAQKMAEAPETEGLVERPSSSGSTNGAPVDGPGGSRARTHGPRPSPDDGDVVVTPSKRNPDGRFVNPWSTWRKPDKKQALKWMLTEEDFSKVPAAEELQRTLPVHKPYFVEGAGGSGGGSPPESVRVTWLGHACVLVELEGFSFLTDPVFSERASPVGFAGPRRYRPAPCTVAQLPEGLDAVLISHNHYDHLDHNSVVQLNRRYGTRLSWFVPLGLAGWMQDTGCENVHELDWWSERSAGLRSNITVAFTPAQHWCKRGAFDDNKVLWGSWCVLGTGARFYFAGDTGYCDVFQQIGRRYGPFTLAAIPIGAYAPSWFMSSQHVDPEAAVKIHVDVRAGYSVGIHWGTFSLANEFYLEPPQKLAEALSAGGHKPDVFFVLQHGETRDVGSGGCRPFPR
ncbi:unnamed protein product [Lampetra planeri]